VNPLTTQGVSGLSRLLDASRYAQLGEGLFKNLVNLGSGAAHPLILMSILAVLLRWQIEERYKLASLIAATSLVLVFLEWQVQTSFDRLILQVWPSVLLVFFLMLRSVVDVAAPSTPVKSEVKSKSSPAVSGKRALAGKQGR
jgi:hypothetical protein